MKKLKTTAITLSVLLSLGLWSLGPGHRAAASGEINAPAAFNVAAGDVAGLIAAINAANDETNHPGPDTINLECGTYTLIKRGDPYNYYGFNGLPVITSNVVIEGNP